MAMYRLGCDVSFWQGCMNWAHARQAGIEFTFIKATDGTTGKDPQFGINWLGAKDVGIDRGAYHFFRNNQDPRLQAENFVNQLGGVWGELPMVVDVEDKGTIAFTAARIMAAIGAARPTVEQNVRTFTDRVSVLTNGEPVMVYTSPAYITTYFKNPSWSQYPLWLANYVSTAPSVPSPWHPGRIRYWQFRIDVNGAFYGASSPKIDLDVEF